MPRNARYPSLFQVNTRVRLTELSDNLGRPATLDDISDDEIDRLAAVGFDWIWFLGVWQTGPMGRQVSLSDADLLREYHRALPDFDQLDVCGSCFSVRSYAAHSEFGGDEALRRLRRRLNDRGLLLMLDFVPNHTAPDHPWVNENPDYYVPGDESRLASEPRNYGRILTAKGPLVLAYGRDPYFPGWMDTLQLNYGNPRVQEAMIGELAKIACLCDGVRCDMAMLLLPEVFRRTWGIEAQAFWPRAIEEVRRRAPGFTFMAEVYWDLEWALQQQGFDYTYDKRLYDRLRDLQARPVRDHLRAGLDFQTKLARFLENHDEPRAAATFPPEVHRAAAVVSFLAPGLRFFHRGQFEGHKVRIPVQLRRGPREASDPELTEFYGRLLAVLCEPTLRSGDWRLLGCLPAWDGNPSWDGFIAFAWDGLGGNCYVVPVNYADQRSQCYIPLPFEHLGGFEWRLRDLMGPASYDRDGYQLLSPGLYLDMPAWGYHVFELTKRE
jgi:Alpha amylase, catalytic domain